MIYVNMLYHDLDEFSKFETRKEAIDYINKKIAEDWVVDMVIEGKELQSIFETATKIELVDIPLISRTE